MTDTPNPILTQEEFEEKFGALFGFSREHVSKIERQATLTIVQKWFYWYIKNYGLPK